MLEARHATKTSVELPVESFERADPDGVSRGSAQVLLTFLARVISWLVISSQQHGVVDIGCPGRQVGWPVRSAEALSRQLLFLRAHAGART